MSKILGYFSQRGHAQHPYSPQLIRDCMGGEPCLVADDVCCLAGGDSAKLSESLRSLRLMPGLACVFSGVLLNARDLWDAYGRSVRESERSDAALCLLLFQKLGDNFASHLNGPFVAAIYSRNERRLWLYRDHLGQLTVYFSLLNNGYTIFSDDLSRLRWLPGCPSQIDLKSLSDYLSLGYIPSPQTFFHGVSKLLPGGCLGLRARGGVPVLHQFWRPSLAPKRRNSMADAVTESRELIERGLDRCLAVQPKSAVMLSGGIDSNLMLALGNTGDRHIPLSVTVGFRDTAYDERLLAGKSAAALGVENLQHEILPSDWSILPTLQKLNGEPYADSSIIPTTIAMTLVAKAGRGVITGSGGDEFFGGYRRYQAMCLRGHLRALPDALVRGSGNLLLRLLPSHGDARDRGATARRFAEFLRESPLTGYARFQQILSPELRQALIHDDRLLAQPLPPADWQRLSAMRTATTFVEHFNEIDLWGYFPDDGCRKEALAGAYAGVSHLCPLMDIDIVEYALTLPRHLRVTLFERKRILRRLARPYVIPELLRQTKRGFGMPVAAWLRTSRASLLHELVADLPHWDTHGWFNPTGLQTLVDQHLAGTHDHGARLWALLCLRAFLE